MAKRYFEFVAGGSSKFWEVTLDDCSQLVRFGKLGTEGQEKTKDFDSPGKARADTKKLVSEKLSKGYVEIGGKPPPQRDAKLEAAIEQNLDEPAPYLAYARWLKSKGDPLADLIVKQVQKPHDRSVLEKHREHILGELASSRELGIRWQFGFMQDVRVDGFDGREAAAELETLLELPAARFIRALHVGSFLDDEKPSLQPFIDVLEEKRAPATLRSLTLGNEGDWEGCECRTGQFAPLAQVFPRLEALTLHAARVDFGKSTSLPELRELTIGSAGLQKRVLKEVLSAKLPKLERLSFWAGFDDDAGNVTVKDLAPILSCAAFPKLVHLGVISCEFSGTLMPELLESKLLAQLTSLDLSKGSLEDADVDAMVAAKASFAQLEELNLDGNRLTAASKKKVKVLAKRVKLGK